MERAGAFEDLPPGSEKFVIAGARGLVAEHVLRGLASLGKQPALLVDNDPRMDGRHIDGIEVVSPEEAIRLYPDAVYVAAIYTHTPLRLQLRALGARRVASYAQLFHRYPEAFLPFFAVADPESIHASCQEIQAASAIWADDQSTALYSALIEWFTKLVSESVPRPLPIDEMYFPPFLALRDDEVFADCGAYDGDTAREYCRVADGRYREILRLNRTPWHSTN